MPPAPPDRPDATAFHYHTYSYPQDAAREAFQLSDALASAEDGQFYSLYEDLLGLVAWGSTKNVPNLRLIRMSGLAGGGQTVGGRETLVLSFGGPPPRPGVASKPAVVFTGGIHAREWIAVEIAYLVAEYLIKHYTTTPQNRYQRIIRDLVNNRRIFIIPMLNPDGNAYTVFTPDGEGRLWRKNRRVLPTTPAAWVSLLTKNGTLGANPPPFTHVQAPAQPPGADATYEVPVYEIPLGIALQDSARYPCSLPDGEIGIDLNRNLRSGGWGYDGLGYPPNGDPQPGGSGFPPSPGYFGPAGGSEAETANLQALLYQVGPGGIAASIDYHSRGQLILFPSELSYFGGVGVDYKMLGMTLSNLVHGAGITDYLLGTPRDLLNADATGTVMDYASQLSQSRAFTIELDPPLTVENGWLLPEDQICGVFEKNIRGALATIAAPLNPATTALATRFYDRILKVFLTWNVYGRGNRLPA